jgi:peptidoglycan/LPS O-acetylase OafA/YrhL
VHGGSARPIPDSPTGVPVSSEKNSAFAVKAGRPRDSSRLDGIDVLRGVSILLVVVHHVNLRIPLTETPLAKYLPAFAVNALGWNGQYGVTIFFAISGFLITTMTLRRWKELAKVSLRDFYMLRFARIAPLLFLLLAVLSVLDLMHLRYFTIDPARASLGRALFAALTFHLNWLEGRHGYLPGNWDVLWSLSIEEMFYLFFPLLCRFLRGGRWMIGVLVGLVVLGPFARVFTHNPIWVDKSYFGNMDAIALGCLAAMLLPRLQLTRRWQMAVEITGIVLIVWVLRFLPPILKLSLLWKTGLDMTVLALGTCMVMLVVAQTRRRGRWFSQPILWFGRHSYEVYLTHMFVVFGIIQIFRERGSPMQWAIYWYLLVIALSAGLGAITARGYSEPMNRFLRRGWARRESR